MLIKILRSRAINAGRCFSTSRRCSGLWDKLKTLIAASESNVFDEGHIINVYDKDKINREEWMLIYRDPGASKTFSMMAILFPCFIIGSAVFVYDVYQNKPTDRFPFVQRIINDSEELGPLIALPTIALAGVIIMLLRVHQIRLLRIYQNRKNVEEFIAIKSKFIVSQNKHKFNRDLSTAFYFADQQENEILRILMHFSLGNVQLGSSRFMIMDDFFRANNYRTFMLNETSVPPRL